MLRQQIRRITTLKNTESVVVNRKFKFSFEASKNKIIADSQLQYKDLHDYGGYKRANVGKAITETDARLIPSVIALHSRLQLTSKISYNSIVRCLNSDTESKLPNNSQLSIFGANFLSYYVTEHLISSYPRLPLSIIRSATDAFIGDLALYDLAQNQWGIEADCESNLDRYLNGEPQLFQFGKLKFVNNVSTPESGISKISNVGISKYTAFANFSRSIVATIFAQDGEVAAKQFIHDHILSRKIDLSKMFDFKEPAKLLNILLKSQNLSSPSIKLLSETGRQSNSPIFVVGCYSGDNLLSTAEGSSLKEARVRSCVKALMAWYLYKPLDSTAPSDEAFNGFHIDVGEKFF